MDTKDLRGLMEAYSEVYAPQEVDEAVKGVSPHAMQMRKDAAAERRGGDRPLSPSAGKANAAKMQRDIKFYDKITKKTKPSVVGMTHEEVENVEEASYSAKAARAGKDIGKPGKAFAKIAASAGKRYGSKERGEKVAGAVLAKLRKEELDIFDAVLEFLQVEGYAETLEEAEWMMANVIDGEAIDIILDEGLSGERYKKALKKGKMYSRMVSKDPSKRATRGGRGGESDFGAGDRGSGNRAARRAGTYQEYNVNEAQHARENPEKYEAGEKKKYAPVRGERTPMPPRGDKRREDFEKWYAKNVR